jgi:predicted peptidase
MAWSLVQNTNMERKMLKQSIGIFMIVSCLSHFSSGQETASQSKDGKLNNKTELDSTADPALLFEPRQFAGADGKVLNYRLLKPKDFKPTGNYPLVIFLHGAGERGDDNKAQLVHGMKEFCKPEWREKFRCYVLAPQCPSGQKWADIDWSTPEVMLPEKISSSLELTFQVVDQMLEDSAIDKTRIYLTGLSMGGYGTWDGLARRPKFFAAAMPICGGGDPKTAELIKDVPIACFHGAQDKVVTPDKSRKMIEALRACGSKPVYVEYENAGHDSWTDTYSSEDNIQWLFDQRLDSNEKS